MGIPSFEHRKLDLQITFCSIGAPSLTSGLGSPLTPGDRCLPWSLSFILFNQLTNAILNVSGCSLRTIPRAHHIAPETATRFCAGCRGCQPAHSCANHTTNQNTRNKRPGASFPVLFMA
jgi:hypothetical protein